MHPSELSLICLMLHRSYKGCYGIRFTKCSSKYFRITFVVYKTVYCLQCFHLKQKKSDYSCYCSLPSFYSSFIRLKPFGLKKAVVISKRGCESLSVNSYCLVFDIPSSE